MHMKHLAQALEHSRSLIDAPSLPPFLSAFSSMTVRFNVLGVMLFQFKQHWFSTFHKQSTQLGTRGKEMNNRNPGPSCRVTCWSPWSSNGTWEATAYWFREATSHKGWPTLPVSQGWRSFLGPRAKIRKVLGTLQEESLVAFVLTPQLPPCPY